MGLELEKLSRQELLEVYAKATSLLGKDAKVADQTSAIPDEAADLYEAMRRRLRDYGAFDTPAYVGFVRTEMGAKFLKLAPDVIAYVMASFQPKSRAERIHLYKMLAQLLLWRLEALNIPVRLKPMLQQLKNIGSIVEQQFPGYAESGLLPFVLSRHLEATAV